MFFDQHFVPKSIFLHSKFQKNRFRYEGHALHESKQEVERKKRAQKEMDDIATYTRKMANSNQVLTGAAAWKAVLQNQSQNI